jgi:hypothetical protein
MMEHMYQRIISIGIPGRKVLQKMLLCEFGEGYSGGINLTVTKKETSLSDKHTEPHPAGNISHQCPCAPQCQYSETSQSGLVVLLVQKVDFASQNRQNSQVSRLNLAQMTQCAVLS